MKPLISVIVPVYNVEKYLCECLDSLLNQTYTNIEIILVDDESKDNSGIICDQYASKHEKVKVIHKKNNGGLGFARNTGLDNVKGSHVIFVDSDDYISIDYVEKMYTAMNENKADTCMGGYTAVKEGEMKPIINGLNGKTFYEEDIIKSILPLMCGRDKNGISVQMSACMVLYSMDIIKTHNLRFVSEREYISEDLLFNINYLSKCHIVTCCDNVGYYYRYNPTSLTHSYLIDRFRKQKIMTQKVVEETKAHGIFELCEKRIANTFLEWTRACLKMEQATINESSSKEVFDSYKTICNDSMVRLYIKKQSLNDDKLFSIVINQLIRYKAVRLLMLIMKLKNMFGV